jgi:cytochrome c-type biogenesis protein CcmE
VKPKRRRLYFVVVGMVLLGAAAARAYAMNDTLVFFYSPSELLAKQIPPGRTLRIGGLVRPAAWRAMPTAPRAFPVTDTAKTVAVVYKGILPDLFREGQGVVAEGTMSQDGVSSPPRCWPSTTRNTCEGSGGRPEEIRPLAGRGGAQSCRGGHAGPLQTGCDCHESPRHQRESAFAFPPRGTTTRRSTSASAGGVPARRWIWLGRATNSATR